MLSRKARIWHKIKYYTFYKWRYNSHKYGSLDYDSWFGLELNKNGYHFNLKLWKFYFQKEY